MPSLLAYIPSPTSGDVHLGPLTLHLYGLTLLVAIVACIWLTGRRWVAQGGDWDLVWRVAVWGVAFGVHRRARLPRRHVVERGAVTEMEGHLRGVAGRPRHLGRHPASARSPALVVTRAGFSVTLFMDAAAPGLLLAQGIGRIGNWWNQELYGKPTTLPVGAEDRPGHRPADPKYLDARRSSPTFLYELLWDVARRLAVCSGSRADSGSSRPACSRSTSSYYTFGRFFEELLRIDPAHHFAGLRLNAWVSIVVFVGSTAFFIWWQFLRADAPGSRPKPKPRPVPQGPKMAIPRGRVR